MSYRKLLTDRCDIYHLHLKEGSTKPSFGVPMEDRQREYEYRDQPDLVDVPCYFSGENQTITQGEPNNVIIQSFIVHFMPNVDVKTNSKIVWNGVEYNLQQPRLFKRHHIEVTAIRSESL